VRLNPPLTILALVGCCLGALTLQRDVGLAEQTQARRAQCDVALSYVKSIRPASEKPLFFSEEPERVAKRENIASFLAQKPELVNDPDVAIARKQAKAGGRSPVQECATLKVWLDKNGVRRGTVGPWDDIDRNDEYPAEIIRTSIPVFSDDRSMAYMNVSHYFGPLGGGGTALVFRKSRSGGWELVSKVGTYIS
jgi:hypothetical protein